LGEKVGVLSSEKTRETRLFSVTTAGQPVRQRKKPKGVGAVRKKNPNGPKKTW